MPPAPTKLKPQTTAGIADRKFLDKRIPKNPKYENVRSTLDTGSSLTNYLDKLRDRYTKYKYRPNEFFKRMKPLTFGKLVMESSFGYDLVQCETEIFGPPFVPGEVADSDQESNQLTPDARQTYVKNFSKSSVIMPDPSGQSPKKHSMAAQMETFPPFLLLDVRDEQLYRDLHIVTARHYSPSTLLRGSNQLTKEIIEFRNNPDKLIIVYDDDETIASKVAQQFAERDIQNVWLLSGGLNVLQTKVQGIFAGNSVTEQAMAAIPSEEPAPPVFHPPPSKTPSPKKQANQEPVAEKYPPAFDMNALRQSLMDASPEPTISDVSSVRSFATNRTSSGGMQTTSRVSARYKVPGATGVRMNGGMASGGRP